ncbi:hypothetical protein Tco_0614046 [Tanacetum coccineum]
MGIRRVSVAVSNKIRRRRKRDVARESIALGGDRRNPIMFLVTLLVVTRRKRVKTKRSHVSLYLYLVMEVLNMIMIKNIKEDKKFKYHYGCKEWKLTYLCFVDDLLTLCNGDVDSLKVVKKSLEEFSNVSSLFPNHNKSTIFFGSIIERRKQELLEIMHFKCGKFPMKYISVPLLANRLGVSDCRSLIDSVASVYRLPVTVKDRPTVEPTLAQPHHPGCEPPENQAITASGWSIIEPKSKVVDKIEEGVRLSEQRIRLG